MNDLFSPEQDYYWYLKSEQFIKAFLKPIAGIINSAGEPCLDVACGEAILADLVTVPYWGFDGSEIAINKARIRISNTDPSKIQTNSITLGIGRIEQPTATGEYGTIVFGGVMEVLIKPDKRVPLLEMYQEKYRAKRFIIYDLERLDTTEIEQRYGKPVIELHGCTNVPYIVDVKNHRKILVYNI